MLQNDQKAYAIAHCLLPRIESPNPPHITFGLNTGRSGPQGHAARHAFWYVAFRATT